MLLCGLHFGLLDNVSLMLMVAALKINQYCLVGMFFLAHAARLSGQEFLIAR